MVRHDTPETAPGTPEEWMEQGRNEMGPYTEDDLRCVREYIDSTDSLDDRRFFLRVYALIQKEINH